MHDPHRAAAVDNPPRMFDPGEDGHVVNLAVAVAINAAKNLPAAWRPSQRTLFVHRDVDFCQSVRPRSRRDSSLSVERRTAPPRIPAGLARSSRNAVSSIAWVRPAAGRRAEVRTAAGRSLCSCPRAANQSKPIRFSANVLRSGGCGAGPPGPPKPGSGFLRAAAALASFSRISFVAVATRLGVLHQPFLCEHGHDQLLEQLLVLLVHCFDGEQPVGQPVLPGVRLFQAQVHQLFRRTHQQKIGQARIPGRRG